MKPRGEQTRPSLKGLWQAFDEATYGQERTLNLREALPSAADARARAEAWLRMRQVMRSDEVLVITGRGNQSVNGVGVIREAIMALLPSLRRKGVVKSWREHTPGSIVITLAPVTTLLGAPKRNRGKKSEDSEGVAETPASLAALEPDTLRLLRQLATRTIESLGISDARPFIKEEMQRVYAALSTTLPVGRDNEGVLRRAISSAIDELEA